ncbi:TIGR04283 family arsenosugar biosynthesis glycosyltransferase [Aliifodinibius salicampi]|uniref:TIGR04283 family arsenosugar biosynthesis glycosyltransferase n=1 Tax=Fodinibius salicampi TaxID=1920655 RepID=A0ABT3PZN0_9BACT|nr:TIGR04283 family arsenosugar biosynthesis glycosyltransferase [Fodinibius salicampi]MCW9713332.1 TIGR04283 family arsenosugar biosynthesis glycosyltransferase [Fodinibius salicampi]
MSISVIIPTYNEADTISETIEKVRRASDKQLTEIIVADGGSTDGTVQQAEAMNVRTLKSPKKGRAAQMNHGAKQARGDILYFLHADTHPPSHFDTSIKKAQENGYESGCFQLTFDHNHPLLRFYAWFTRFDIDLFRFGDQSLFINRTIFDQIGGFREDYIVMEDQEITRRIKKHSSFIILDNSVTTSAQKYQRNGIIKLQLVFSLILFLYYLGADQKQLTAIYKCFID